ncbi:MAG: SDR family NAD(P)-dependent oxidoreductase [Rhodospirillales bacterium]|nr:SDR family NAD(P)-dependent oxidoreductase [Rhodospirillales bacterium]
MTQSSKAGTALVTGASSGIGAVYADRFAKRGYDLILVARDEVRLNALAEKLRAQHGVAASVLPADLSTEVGIQAVEERLAAESAINLFVNNAGIARLGTLAEMRPQDISDIIQLNVNAASRLAAAARAFAPRKAGRIINIASVLALVSEHFNPVYNASKAFVLSLSQSMQNELAPLGVNVQAVLPGATRTEIWSRAGADISVLPPEMVMGVDEMVDAALVGFDRGETVTIPALPDAAEFEAFTQARLKMGPNLSRDHAAARYRTHTVA